jgi:hypothetical protein
MALKGTLGKETLADLFNTLHTWTMSGLIVLITPDHRGVIYIARGKPIDAAIICVADHAIVAQGEHALHQVMAWSGATYRFLENPAVSTRPVRITAGAQTPHNTLRHDSARLGEWITLTLDTQIQLSLAGLSEQASQPLEMRHWRVIGALGEARALRELSARTGIAMPEVVRTVGELLRQGLVEFAREELREDMPKLIRQHVPLREQAMGEPHTAVAGQSPNERAMSRSGRLNIAQRVRK